MSWEIRFAGPARRQLRGLSPAIAAAVVEFATTTLAENPLRLSKPLHGDFDHLRSARRGDYRVLLLVDEGHQVAVVVRIAHRTDVYRPPPP